MITVCKDTCTQENNKFSHCLVPGSLEEAWAYIAMV